MKKKNLLIVSLAVIFLSASCLNKENASGAISAMTITVSATDHYGDNATAFAHNWASGDYCSYLTVGNMDSKGSAAPITPGGESATFLFNTKASKGDAIAVWYPSSASVTTDGRDICFQVPQSQTGTVSTLLLGKTAFKSSSVTLSQPFCVFYMEFSKGSYSIASLSLKSNGGEKIAGDVAWNADSGNYAATEDSISVNLPVPVDCSVSGAIIPIMAAPAMLSSGYTLSFKDSDGNANSVSVDEKVSFAAGGMIRNGGLSNAYTTQLIVTAADKIFLVDADLATTESYGPGVIWSWNAKEHAGELGLSASSCDHIDDCKPVDNGSKFLITSSYNWCALVSRETGKVLFNTIWCGDAHSAEILPDNRIVVACSSGTGAYYNCLQVYDLSKSNTILSSLTLDSAHGVVWDQKTQRLYAIGGQSLFVCKLEDWDSSSPSLSVEKVIGTPYSGLHDLTYSDENTLCVSGNHCYLYDVLKGTFTELKHFSASTSLKSVNYNTSTGECWYTDATNSTDTEYSWRSHTIYHTTDVNGTSVQRTIGVADGMYKVRVLYW